MKYLFILVLVLLFACENTSIKVKEPQVEQMKDYTCQTIDSFNKLKSPVVLIATRKSLGSYGIVVKDSTGKVECYGNMSAFADIIGASRCVGDTLK